MKIIIGNWKMNGDSEALNNLFNDLSDVKTKNHIVLCVPFTLLNTKSDQISLGAQDVSEYESGTHTGEISAKMIADTGAKYVIVGHSERRASHNETNAIVRAKAEQVLENKMTPVICIGETAQQHDAGQTQRILNQEIRECVPPTSEKIIIAYEPRWAIGTGKIPSDSELAETLGYIHKTLESAGIINASVLYGGSVTPKNATEIMNTPGVDGVLVGGASLKSDEFIPIITSIK